MTRIGWLMTYLKELLFDKGQGWLRWGLDVRSQRAYSAFNEDYTVAPPLRRLAMGLQCIWSMVVGYPKLLGYAADTGEHLVSHWRREWHGFSDPWGIGHQWFRDEDRKGGLRFCLGRAFGR